MIPALGIIDRGLFTAPLAFEGSCNFSALQVVLLFKLSKIDLRYDLRTSCWELSRCRTGRLRLESNEIEVV